jgi:hypothetical protein
MTASDRRNGSSPFASARRKARETFRREVAGRLGFLWSMVLDESEQRTHFSDIIF